jgi:hypothetical protein
MFAIFLIEVIMMIVSGILIISQIIIPAYQGRKIFPMFTKLSKMEAAEVALKQKICELAKQHSINNIMKETK